MDQEVRITLRLPEALRDRIAARRKVLGRSMNAEIVSALEKAYPDEDTQLHEALRLIDERIEASGDDPDPRLLKLREKLMVKRWYVPIEDAE